MKKIFKVSFYVVMLVIVTFNIFSAMNIPFFGFQLFRVGSGSMEPILSVNDLVLVQKKEKYQIDDIITFKNNDAYVTHRIIEINGDNYLTKGDANNTVDDEIDKDAVIGKMIYKFMILGFISNMFRSPIALVLLFVIGIFITILIPDSKK